MTRYSSDPTISSTGNPKIPATTSLACLFTWIGTRGDYSSIERRDRALKGWRRKISPVTLEGRFNIVIGTWITSAIVGYFAWQHYKETKKDSNITSSSK